MEIDTKNSRKNPIEHSANIVVVGVSYVRGASVKRGDGRSCRRRWSLGVFAVRTRERMYVQPTDVCEAAARGGRVECYSGTGKGTSETPEDWL